MKTGRRDPKARGAADALAKPIFFDTNVLVYAYGPDDEGRSERALLLLRDAMRERRFVVSTQVLVEFYAVVLRKRYLSAADARDVLNRLSEHRVVPATADSVLRAVDLQRRSQLSIWDALVIQAALDADCATVFSEDLQHGQRFSHAEDAGRYLHVIDPFRCP